MSDTVFLHVRYKAQDEGDLIGHIDDLGFGADMRIQFCELTFAQDADPDYKNFMLAVPESDKDRIEVEFTKQPGLFQVSFSDPPDIELTPEAEAAARARLTATGFKFD